MATIQVNLKENERVEVRIEDGLLKQIIYNTTTQSVHFDWIETEDIKMALRDILKADVEKFKQLLHEISGDLEFYNYGRDLLAKEYKTKNDEFLKKRIEMQAELAKLKTDMDQYLFFD